MTAAALPKVGDCVRHVDGTVGVVVSVNAHLPLATMVRDKDGSRYEFDLRNAQIYGGPREAVGGARAKFLAPTPVVRHVPAGSPPPAEPVQRWMEDPLLAWMHAPGVDIDAVHSRKKS